VEIRPGFAKRHGKQRNRVEIPDELLGVVAVPRLPHSEAAGGREASAVTSGPRANGSAGLSFLPVGPEGPSLRQGIPEGCSISHSIRPCRVDLIGGNAWLQRILVACVANFAPDLWSNLLLHLILKVCKVPAVKTCGLKPAHTAQVAQGDGLLNRMYGPGAVELGHQMVATTAISNLHHRPMTTTVTSSPALVTSRANGPALESYGILRAVTYLSRVRGVPVGTVGRHGHSNSTLVQQLSGGN
jgi:hypothetical protein